MTSLFLTETETYESPRSWRERLFGWPWRPWVIIKTASRQVPSKQILRLPGHFLMHPQLFAALENSLGEKR